LKMRTTLFVSRRDHGGRRVFTTAGLRGCATHGLAGLNFPLFSEEGWLRDQKSREASIARADGVVFNLNKILWNWITTPSAP
jgi:hypothetical protein